MSEIKTIPFEEMTTIQQRLHNAAIVLDCDGDEYGFTSLIREAINKITELRAALAERDRQVRSYESMVSDRDELLSNLWRPIETAPRDGGVIIVRGGQNVSIGWWYGVGLNAWLPHNCEPTHWMPLPKPPIDAMREGGES